MLWGLVGSFPLAFIFTISFHSPLVLVFLLFGAVLPHEVIAVCCSEDSCANVTAQPGCLVCVKRGIDFLNRLLV